MPWQWNEVEQHSSLGLCSGECHDSTPMDASTDMDMMKSDSAAAAVGGSASSGVQDDVAGGLLTMARQLVDQGKPTHALQAVVMAMRAKGGEGAVIWILQRARELYWSNLQASSEADQLASLFAECAIAESQPARAEACTLPAESMTPNTMLASSMDSNPYKTSILAENGGKQIMLDAFSDGSSFICLKCGGLVSIHRKDEHCAFWCQF